MNRFDQRSDQKELMDDLACSGEVLEQTLRELKIINRWLGGNNVTTSGLRKLFKTYPQELYTIADVGCGGGDMVRIMHGWTKREGVQAKFQAVDANPNIIEIARERLKDLTEVEFLVQNVFDPAFESEKVDVVTCTLFTHHFTDSELVSLLTAFRQKVRLGVVINDLHRHPFAYHSIRILTQFFSKSLMVRHDAKLSVLRSFSRADWERILVSAGISTFKISWHWAFRWQVNILFLKN
jgi:2-polyprenyl-3-methyl-5-hydroxy-6-metoxy-1,4-benzoquinol methylase